MVYVNDLNPIMLEFGIFQIRWYGLLWVLGIIFIWLYLKKAINDYEFKNNERLLEKHDELDLITWLVIGAILGARVFYVLFYNFNYYFSNAGKILAIWEGGLSFHGGLIGAAIAGYAYCRKYKKDFWALADLVAIPIGLALFLGRIGNFINGELVGRKVSETFALAVNFGDGARHPSQLYEAAKNLIIFIYLHIRKNYAYQKGMLFVQLILFYAGIRFLLEFFREPDSQIGYLAFGLSLGQYINIFMLIAGIWFYMKIKKGYLY